MMRSVQVAREKSGRRFIVPPSLTAPNSCTAQASVYEVWG